MKSNFTILALTVSILMSSLCFSQIQDSTFNAIESKVVQWRHEIHQNPELSNREFKTAAKVAELAI